MNKFALVGKNISHSKSPEMYRKIISPTIDYDLLDYDDSSKIPRASELLLKYDGLNITSPYKKHFLNEVELTLNAKEIGAINCLKKTGNKIIGENTDYLAVRDIIQELGRKFNSPLDIIILGDGVMSSVTQLALKKLNLNYKVLSRKITNDFDQLIIESTNSQLVIINTCSREYVFQGKVPSQAVFWDFNYDFLAHKNSLPQKVQLYFDGLDMLERQAFYAVSFWSNHN